MSELDVYRVRSDRWRRSWQAEWPGCRRAVRAWTEVGVLRRAARARARELRVVRIEVLADLERLEVAPR